MIQYDFIEARRALRFAQAHDWGQHAVLKGNDINGYTIGALIDRDEHGERCEAQTVATIEALRLFGNY